MSTPKNNLHLLASVPVSRALLSLGLPIMVGMLINALYNLVDAYFVSGLGEASLGAISVVFPLSQVIVGLGLMFGNGAASYLSRLLGQKIQHWQIKLQPQRCTGVSSPDLLPLSPSSFFFLLS